MIKQQLNKNINKNKNNNNTQIIKEIIKNINIIPSNKVQPIINCTQMIGQILVRGINEGYDEFTISLNEIFTKMFVSVYKPIQPHHSSVAIAININEPYTMHWSAGPLPWPIKEEIPIDNQFIHPLQVDIPYNNNNNNTNDKYYGFNYNGKILEFICYKSFHNWIQLSVSNRVIENNLLYPIISIVNIEIFCLKQFKFNSSVMEMGVGTRKNTNILYPQIDNEFYIKISQMDDINNDIISIINNNNIIAKRLGSSHIIGTLHSNNNNNNNNIHIHPIGFNDKLEIIVLFKDFIIEMSSYYIINGAQQIAHIEGLDGDHHILPFRHNFDIY